MSSEYTFPLRCGPWHLILSLYEDQRLEHGSFPGNEYDVFLTSFLTRLPFLTAVKMIHNPVPIPCPFSPSLGRYLLDTSRNLYILLLRIASDGAPILLKAYISGYLNLMCIFGCLKTGAFDTNTRNLTVNWTNLFKPSEIKHHQTGCD